MLPRILRKRTIILILLSIIVLPTIFAVILRYDFVWWLQSSSFFALTVIVGIFIGQLTTVYKIKHLVETRVDELVNRLSIPKIARLDDPNLEVDSFIDFSNGLITLLCNDFNYAAGIIHIFNDSLKTTFRHSLKPGPGQSLKLTFEDYKLLKDWCRFETIGQITVRRKSQNVLAVHFPSKSNLDQTVKVDTSSALLEYSYMRLLPIHLDSFYLGYIVLLKDEGPSALERFVDAVQDLTEKSILQAIEDKKIDDAVKSFLFRQTLLQVFITLKILDDIYDGIGNFQSLKDLGDRIVEALKVCWRFNGCLILTQDGILSHDLDEGLSLKLIESKLLPRVKLRLSSGENSAIYMGTSADVYEDEKPGFQDFVGIRICKDGLVFGYLVATSKRQLTEFEKQMLIILENYKIDDAYSLMYSRKAIQPPPKMATGLGVA